MSIVDKITGRTKKAAGDLLDDADLRRQGGREEHKGEAKERHARAEEKADHAEARAEREAQEVANLERRT